MHRHHIDTAGYHSFTDAQAAKDYVTERGAPIVIKADGLAAGRGVVVAETLEQAHAAIDSMLDSGEFGQAGARGVMEDFLEGIAGSIIVLWVGQIGLAMPTRQ